MRKVWGILFLFLLWAGVHLILSGYDTVDDECAYPAFSFGQQLTKKNATNILGNRKAKVSAVVLISPGNCDVNCCEFEQMAKEVMEGLPRSVRLYRVDLQKHHSFVSDYSVPAGGDVLFFQKGMPAPFGLVDSRSAGSSKTKNILKVAQKLQRHIVKLGSLDAERKFLALDEYKSYVRVVAVIAEAKSVAQDEFNGLAEKYLGYPNVDFAVARDSEYASESRQICSNVLTPPYMAIYAGNHIEFVPRERFSDPPENMCLESVHYYAKLREFVVTDLSSHGGLLQNSLGNVWFEGKSVDPQSSSRVTGISFTKPRVACVSSFDSNSLLVNFARTVLPPVGFYQGDISRIYYQTGLRFLMLIAPMDDYRFAHWLNVMQMAYQTWYVEQQDPDLRVLFVFSTTHPYGAVEMENLALVPGVFPVLRVLGSQIVGEPAAGGIFRTWQTSNRDDDITPEVVHNLLRSSFHPDLAHKLPNITEDPQDASAYF